MYSQCASMLKLFSLVSVAMLVLINLPRAIVAPIL
jgi:hypothetical protein